MVFYNPKLIEKNLYMYRVRNNRHKRETAGVPLSRVATEGAAMPNYPDRSSADAPLTVLVFPGLSIMQRRWLSAGLLVVRCPGCGASQIFSTANVPATFVHDDDECPILRRIEAALTRLRAAQAAESN